MLGRHGALPAERTTSGLRLGALFIAPFNPFVLATILESLSKKQYLISWHGILKYLCVSAV